MEDIRHINGMPKTGTSRAYQKRVLDPAGEISPEERDVEDLLSMIVQIAKRVKYINYQNTPDGTWAEFFNTDPTFVLADILSFDSGRNQAEFETQIKALKYSLFIGESGEEKWHLLMHGIFDLLVRADGWFTAFKRTDEVLSGFRKELWSIREELQTSLHDLIRLHRQFEEISGHEMDLSLSQLANFGTISTAGTKNMDNEPYGDTLNSTMIKKLEEIYREFSNKLHHLKGASERYFRRSFFTQNHEPQSGLIIAFLQLYRELSSSFDDFTDHHRSFYYKDVLRQLPKEATPDKAVLIFSISDQFNYVSLPEDTLFPAGQTEAGEEITFKTTTPIALNRAGIKRIRTFMLGNNELYKPSGIFEDEFVTGIYVADRTELNFSGEKWPLLGEDQTDLLKQNRTMDDALVGFALSSPAFYLKDGDRDVRLQFHMSEESYIEFIEFVTEIAFSEKRTDDIGDEERIQGLLIRLFMDGFLLDYTSDEGWVEKERFNIDIKQNEEVRDNNSSNRSDTHDEINVDPILEVSFKLGKYEPSVSAYQPDIHGMSFRKSDPVIRLRLNPDAHLFPYSVIRGLKISSISCQIDVSGLNDLIVYNEIGLVNATEAFLPFGPVPVRKSWMAISHQEAFNKNIDCVSLEITWEQLPDAPHGFHTYYSGYPGSIDNQSFKIRLSELDESRWKPLEKQNRYLFRTEQQREPGKPEALGRLTDVTRIENISLVNTSVVDRPEKMQEIPEYTSKTEQGFLKLSLTEPDTAFGHKQYPMLMSNTFLQNAKIKKPKNMVSMPNEPYTPMVQRLTLDYYQAFNKTVKENSERGGIDLYHIRAFDNSVIINADLQDDTEYLFPQSNHMAQIIFEIEGAAPPQILSLFFQLRDNIRDNTLTAMPSIGWEFYMNDEWREFSPDAIIRDGTNGFMNSGIVVLELPEILRHDQLFHDTGIIQIRAFADDHADIVARAVGITTQAAEVERVITNGQEGISLIPGGTISDVKTTIKGLNTITQPLPSYGGKSPENAESLIIRVSERLKHRGKAVVSRDFERLILHEFDDVRMVNCLPGVSTENKSRDPGSVLVVVIPDITRYPDTSRYRPRFSAGRLYEMESFLRNKTTEFASVEVRNPRYERITIRCVVRFKRGIQGGLFLKKLNMEISKYISPWCYDEEIAIEFGSSLNLTNINGFIHSRPYVESVSGLSAVKISMKKNNEYELSDTARLEADPESGGVEIKPTRAWSVMVSDKQHNIRLVTDDDILDPDHDNVVKAGIENLKLGDSFIIDKWVDESVNLTD